MYEEYYNLSSDPFRLTPTGKHCFEHPSYRKSRSYLEYALHRGEGMVMISGPPGTGKTTLIKSVARSVVSSDIQMNILSCDTLNAQDLIRLYASDLGLEFDTESVGMLLVDVSRELKRLSNAGKHLVLVLDEAQGLTISALEQARLLTNYQHGDKPLLQIVLVGQPDLKQKVLSPELAQLHQRIISSTSLDYLNESETRDYFLHRLTSAGWSGNPVFQEDIYTSLFTASEGIPRWINQVGSRLLLNGFVEQKQEIGLVDIKQVVSDLFHEKLLPCSMDMSYSSTASARIDNIFGD